MSITLTVRRFVAATAVVIGSTACATNVPADGTYAAHPAALEFARQMQDEHGLDAASIMATLSAIAPDEQVIRLITPPATRSARSWSRYRQQFIEPVRINNGLAFWNENDTALHAASQQYGVPEEIIVAIIGVETIYGRYTGTFTTASALATLAFDYPPRAPLFRRELENLFLLAREQGREPMTYEGSYAGAMGYPQFLPSSIRNFAVDFDGDGRIDLERSPADAIGSVANYLAKHGWRTGGPVAIRAHVEDAQAVAPLIAAGIDPVFTAADFDAHRALALDTIPTGESAALIDLESPDAATEYWLGFRNFYVITRYNRSSFYAMAVFQLARALRSASSETTVDGVAH